MSLSSGGGKEPPDRNASGPWGPTHPRGGPGASSQTYSSITSINTSKRDNKNILEIKLEKQDHARFNLTMEESEQLLKRLGILSSEVLGVSACPEGRPVVLITLHSSVEVTRFLYKNESYIVKDGVRTTTIRPEGKKEKVVKITGLHPNTKDQAVVKYLSAHGSVSPTAKIVHHVFPGEPGTSLLAGKLNGNRSYLVDLKVPMGSYHIIDGEKVTVRYRGQEWTCARCHKYKQQCPGSAVARDCTADRVLLSAHMKEHWEKIGYKPETDTLNEVDEELDLEIQVGGMKQKELNLIPESSLSNKYHSVIIKGFRSDTPLESVREILMGQGLPSDFNSSAMVRNEKNGIITIENLEPQSCLHIVSNMNGKRFLNRQIHVTSVVSASPVKEKLSEPLLNLGPAKLPSEVYTTLDPTVSSQVSPTQVKENLSQPQLDLSPSRVSVEVYTPLDLSHGNFAADPKESLNQGPASPVTDPAGENLVPDLGKPLKKKVPSINLVPGQPPGKAMDLLSPTVQEKINQIEGKASSTPEIESKNLTRIDKRKSEGSPESAELSRKELKILKGEERKQDKLKRRLEYKQKNTIQINNSY